MISIRMYGEDQLADIARQLRRGDGILRRELRQGLEQAARPAVTDLKARIAGADVSGRRTGSAHRFTAHIGAPPLRSRLARAVESDISTSSGGPRVEIRLREGSLGPRPRAVAKFIVGGASRWRHPIMGNRAQWASQNAPNVWWKTLKRHMPRFRREIDEAVEHTARQLEQH